jgi:FdrA protein
LHSPVDGEGRKLVEDAIRELLTEPIVVINLGLRRFAENLEEQDVEVVQVDWTPPAGGDQELIDLLDRLI